VAMTGAGEVQGTQKSSVVMGLIKPKYRLRVNVRLQREFVMEEYAESSEQLRAAKGRSEEPLPTLLKPAPAGALPQVIGHAGAVGPGRVLPAAGRPEWNGEQWRGAEGQARQGGGGGGAEGAQVLAVREEELVQPLASGGPGTVPLLSLGSRPALQVRPNAPPRAHEAAGLASQAEWSRSWGPDVVL
jgi:hypothetical protein